MLDKIKTYPSGASLVFATHQHAISLAPRLRPYDELECHAFGLTPLAALVAGLDEAIDCYTVLGADDKPMAMFGTTRVPVENTVSIWLLTAKGFERYAYDFIRDSQTMIEHLLEPHGSAVNYVYAGYEQAIKWLKFCGASFHTVVEIGGLPFIKFSLTSIS